MVVRPLLKNAGSRPVDPTVPGQEDEGRPKELHAQLHIPEVCITTFEPALVGSAVHSATDGLQDLVRLPSVKTFALQFRFRSEEAQEETPILSMLRLCCFINSCP